MNIIIRNDYVEIYVFDVLVVSMVVCNEGCYVYYMIKRELYQ